MELLRLIFLQLVLLSMTDCAFTFVIDDGLCFYVCAVFSSCRMNGSNVCSFLGQYGP